MLLKIALFFVFFVWIVNGVSELAVRNRENLAREKEVSTAKVWLLGIMLPILLLSAIIIWHWYPHWLNVYAETAPTL
ncbi:MAG: hypothetical protein Q7R93_01610 [bacterium]|nr:hypothetical protein [bacterium]